MRVLIKNQQSHRYLDRIRIKKVARKILSLLKRHSTELSILFVDDGQMKQLNAVYRGIDKTTDVLSFPQASHFLLGDVVINVSKAEAQAKMSGTGFYNEVYHLLIHGILHLLGYDHEKSKSEALVMRKKEQEILGAIKKVG